MPAIAPHARIRHDYDVQRRHLPRVLHTAAELGRHSRFSGEEQASAELTPQLLSFWRSLWNTTYYRDTLGKSGFGLSDVQSLSDMANLPMLERSALRERWRDFLPLDTSSSELCAVRSSGSTGEPLMALKDGFDQVHMWGVLRFWMAHLSTELPAQPRVCLLDALPGGLEYGARLPLLNDGFLERISTVLPDPVSRMQDFNPQVVFSDPAGLHWLASNPLPVSLLLSSAQYLAPALRTRLKSPILNYYSTTETGPIAWECLQAQDCWHVLAPDVWVESVESELVVTRLRPSAMPLLRYKTGDRGRVGFERCACGLRGWSISGFTGRRACWFENPRGEKVDAWQLAWLFKQFALTEFQMTQECPSRFLVEIASQDSHAALISKLTQALGVLGWPSAEIELRYGIAPLGALKPSPFRSRLNGHHD